MDRSETVDRALLGACAVVWLAVIGVSVAAVVALVELGSGRAGEPAPNSGTPWGLYVVIGISAAIILASVPLLLRARRAAQQEPPRRPPSTAPPSTAPRSTAPPSTAPRRPAAPAVEVPIEKLRVFGSVADSAGEQPPGGKRPPPPSPYGGTLSDDLVEALWLRFTLSMTAAMGVATLAVATATYFMAVKHDGWAWAALTVAGIVTALMPLIPWRQLRPLRA
ncbi:MAG TPA: DUF2561 family protein [Mycobacterium sp.]